MRVLICPESFGVSLTAVQAAEAMTAGWREGADHDEVTTAPMSDGGAGFLGVLSRAWGGTTIGVTVSDPLGRPVPGAVLLVDGENGRTAYLEAAQAAGMHLLDAHERDPRLTSSYGVGALIEAALEERADRIVISVAGVASHDGGAGMICALGGGDPTFLGRGASALHEAPDEAVAGLSAARERLGSVEVVVASDDETPLLGFNGVSATQIDERGADRSTTQLLESCLGRWSDLVARALPARRDLLGGGVRRLERLPGSGAGGGLAYGLTALGAGRASAVGICLDAWDFPLLMSTHDLVVTGRERFDWRNLRSGVATGVAKLATGFGVPVVVIAGEVGVGRRESMAIGVSGLYPLAGSAGETAAFWGDPVAALTDRTARLARTWSPAPA